MVKVILCFVLLLVQFDLVSQTSKEKKASRWIDNGKYEKAIRKISSWLEKDHSADLYHLRGYAYSKVNQSNLALADFNKSIELNSMKAQFYFDRGYEHFLQNKSLKALQDFNRAIQLDLNFAEAFLNRGTVKFQMGDETGACKDWSTAESLGIEIAREIIAANCSLDHD